MAAHQAPLPLGFSRQEYWSELPAPKSLQMVIAAMKLPGPLFEGNPVGEGITRRGTATPVHRPQSPAVNTRLDEVAFALQ